MAPTVSVIVPVRNEARSIERTLRRLLVQDFPRERYEVIVADGVSTDETVPIVRRLQAEFPNLKLVFNAGRFSSAGRNMALRHAVYDVAVIVDGHCQVPDARYLHNLAAAFENQWRRQSRPAATPRRCRTDSVPARGLRARSSRLGHNPDSDIFSTQARFVPPQSTAIAYTRAVFQRVGLFDEAFDACEDVEFNERVDAAGLTCYFTPAAKIVYEPRRGFSALFHQLARYGRGRARLAFKHPRSLSLPALVPPLWAVWLILGGLASLLSSSVARAWLGSLGLYAIVLLAAAAVLGRGQPRGVARRIPHVFVAIHFGFAWGFWKEVLRQLTARLRPLTTSLASTIVRRAASLDKRRKSPCRRQPTFDQSHLCQ